MLLVGCDGCVMPIVEGAVVLRGCDEKETAVFAILCCRCDKMCVRVVERN